MKYSEVNCSKNFGNAEAFWIVLPVTPGMETNDLFMYWQSFVFSL